jgi:hypothetical protein
MKVKLSLLRIYPQEIQFILENFLSQRNALAFCRNAFELPKVAKLLKIPCNPHILETGQNSIAFLTEHEGNSWCPQTEKRTSTRTKKNRTNNSDKTDQTLNWFSKIGFLKNTVWDNENLQEVNIALNLYIWRQIVKGVTLTLSLANYEAGGKLRLKQHHLLLQL